MPRPTPVAAWPGGSRRTDGATGRARAYGARPMGAATFYTLAVVFVLVCLILSLLILIQRGRGGGLSSAFGGAGGNTAFGSKTGDVLTWATAGVFAVFILLSMGLVWSGNAYAERVAAERGGVRSAPVLTEEAEEALMAGEASSLPNPPNIPEPGATQGDDNVPATNLETVPDLPPAEMSDEDFAPLTTPTTPTTPAE